MSGLLSSIRLVASFIDRINEFVGNALAWLALLLVLNVFLVVAWQFTGLAGDIKFQETYVWLHAYIFMLGAGYTLLHDGHVRIDLIYAGASERYKAWVNLLGSIFLAAPVLWLIFDRGIDFFNRSYSRLESSAEAGGLPALYLLKAVIPAMAIILGIQFLSLALKSIHTLITGEKIPQSYDEEEPLI